tara:strand:+ start:1816 stop:2286 length:471 start_codon:yes stop_codon:yes gene_type:complete
MDALINKTIQWHNDRNLIEGSTDVAQHTKLVEEVKELETNILLSQPIADDIGDILVVLINIARRNHLSLYQCLQVAYDDIKDRKGKMVNGVFVKERIAQSATAPTVYKKGIIYRMGFIDGRKKVARGDIWKEFGDHSLTYNQGYNAGLIHEQGGRL